MYFMVLNRIMKRFMALLISVLVVISSFSAVSFAAQKGNSPNGQITIGTKSLLSKKDKGNSKILNAYPCTLSKKAKVESLSIYVEDNSKGGKVRLGIFADNKGRPGKLMANTAEFIPASLKAWSTKNVISPVTLKPGTYWLAFECNNDKFTTRNGDLPKSKRNVQNKKWNYGKLPSSFPTGSGFSYDKSNCSFYATLMLRTDATPTPEPIPTETPSPTPSPSPTSTPTPPVATGWQSLDKNADGTGAFPMAARHSLGSGNAGIVDTEFDWTFNDGVTATNVGAIIAYTDSTPIDPLYYSGSNILVRFDAVNGSGKLEARNGDSYMADTAVPFVEKGQYHFRLKIDIPNQKFDAWVTPLGGVETKFATNYAFRTGGGTIDDLGLMTVVTDNGLPAGAFTISNHAVTGCQTPTQTPTPIPTLEPTPTSSPTSWYSYYGNGAFTVNMEHSLGANNSGTLTVEYDATLGPNVNTSSCNCGMIFMDSTVPAGSWWAAGNVEVRFGDGSSPYIQYRDGGSWKDSTIKMSDYTQQQYHFKITADLSANTYSVWVTPLGQGTTQIATNAEFRTGAAAIDDLGTMIVTTFDPTTADQAFWADNVAVKAR
jgi:hypothetical protein